MDAPSSQPFFTWRKKKLSKLHGFMLYGKTAVDFLSTIGLLFPNVKIRLRVSRARPNFYRIATTPTSVLEMLTVRLTFVVLLWNTIATKNGRASKAFTLVEIIYLETLANILFRGDRKNKRIEGNILNYAPVCWIAVAMIANSALIESNSKNSFW